jgi:hypothetical protein
MLSEYKRPNTANLFDITLQLYGTLESLKDILNDNTVAILNELPTTVVFDDSSNNDVLQDYYTNNIKVVTDEDENDYNVTSSYISTNSSSDYVEPKVETQTKYLTTSEYHTIYDLSLLKYGDLTHAVDIAKELNMQTLDAYVKPKMKLSYNPNTTLLRRLSVYNILTEDVLDNTSMTNGAFSIGFSNSFN